MGLLGLKRNCLFCGNKSLRVFQHSSRESHLILMKWGIDSSRSFCQLLNLDQAESLSSLNCATYCDSCHQMFTDVLFLQRSIQSFQDRLNDIKALSTSLILDNYKRYILRKDSPFSDQVVVDGHKDNAYYEALKSIGTSLQPLLHEIKHESAPGEMVIADVEESEHSVGVGAFVKVRVNEESSEYDHVEGVQEDRSPVVGKNCRNQLRKRPRRFRQKGDGEMDPLRCDTDTETDRTTIVTSAKIKRMHFSSPATPKVKAKHLDDEDDTFKWVLINMYGTDEMSAIIHDHLFPSTHDGGKRVYYSCRDCNFSSYLEEIYLAHVREKHQDEPDPCPFHCPKCPKKFRSFNFFGSHFLKSHEVLHLTCNKCQLSLETLDQFKRHSASHRKDKLLQRCSICSVPVTTEGKIAHKALHDSKSNPSACVLCDKGQDFRNQLMLQIHVKELHLTENGEKCRCTWPGCAKELKNQKSLYFHVRYIHERRRIAKCHICDRVCGDKSKLKIHLLTHGEERGFLCDKCPYAAKTPTTLYQHIVSHKLLEKRVSTGLDLHKSKGFGSYRTRKIERVTTGEEASGATGSDKAHVPKDTDAACTVCGRPCEGRGGKGSFICYPCRSFYRKHSAKEPGEMRQCDSEPKGDCIIGVRNPNCISCRFKKVDDARRELEVDESIS